MTPAPGSARYGAKKVYRAKGPRGPRAADRRRDGEGDDDNDISYALFGGGLLGFEIGAGLTARLNAGVTMEVTEVKV